MISGDIKNELKELLTSRLFNLLEIKKPSCDGQFMFCDGQFMFCDGGGGHLVSILITQLVIVAKIATRFRGHSFEVFFH